MLVNEGEVGECNRECTPHNARGLAKPESLKMCQDRRDVVPAVDRTLFK